MGSRKVSSREGKKRGARRESHEEVRGNGLSRIELFGKSERP